jgi:hypothetical protein
MIVDTTQLDSSEEIVFLEERRVAPVLVEFPGDSLTTQQLRALEQRREPPIGEGILETAEQLRLLPQRTMTVKYRDPSYCSVGVEGEY